MSSLLDDLKDEAHAHTLAYGNIPKMRLPGFKAPAEELERFTTEGYTAAIWITVCKGCGTVHRSLGNIMQYSTGSKGSRRAYAIHEGHKPEFPPDSKLSTTTLENSVQVCIACVASYGFSLPSTTEPLQ